MMDRVRSAALVTVVLLVTCGVVVWTAPLVAQAPRGTVEVKIAGLRSDSGHAIIAIFRREGGFPSHTKAWKTLSAPISSGTASVLIPDLPAGAYAISVLHDENGNGQVDTNWIGLPAEGVGVSNNAKGFMGPPSYEDAVFHLKAGATVHQSIRVMYL